MSNANPPTTGSPAQRPSAQSDVRGAATDLKSRAGEMGRDLADGARARAEHEAEGQMHASADRLGTVAHALQASADELRGKEDWLATAFSSAAQHIEGASEHLHSQNVEGLASELSGFARRHPAAFLGGTVALGFALSRLSKAATSRTTPNSKGPGYEQY